MMDNRKVRRALRRTVGKSNIFSGPLFLVFTLPSALMVFVFRRFHVLLCIFATLFLDPTVILSHWSCSVL